MARHPRITVPGLPHHITQRGNRREPIFFEDSDQDVYCDLLAEQTRKARVDIWAYCLMPNHVHLIAVPQDEASLGRAIGETHRRYTNFINARGRWTGHLFQSRFASVAMDEAHLIAAVRYVSLNPVRALLVARAEDWPWSSVRAHLSGTDDGLVQVKPILARASDFKALLASQRNDDEQFAAIRRAEGTGRPLANAAFIADLERLLGRPIARRAPGRKPAPNAAVQAKLL
ncbi:MAG: transposase [Alphaproteobacteria bacterium]|nr:transposase [Alphaproteobacteria bacterium]